MSREEKKTDGEGEDDRSPFKRMRKRGEEEGFL